MNVFVGLFHLAVVLLGSVRTRLWKAPNFGVQSETPDDWWFTSGERSEPFLMDTQRISFYEECSMNAIRWTLSEHYQVISAH